MSAPRNDISIYKGQRVTIPCLKVQADGVTPEDITGHTYVLTARVHATDTDAVLSLNATLTDPMNGKYQFDLLHAATVALAVGNYIYDIQRTDPGSEAPVSIGTFTVTQEVLYQ